MCQNIENPLKKAQRTQPTPTPTPMWNVQQPPQLRRHIIVYIPFSKSIYYRDCCNIHSREHMPLMLDARLIPLLMVFDEPGEWNAIFEIHTIFDCVHRRIGNWLVAFRTFAQEMTTMLWTFNIERWIGIRSASNCTFDLRFMIWYSNFEDWNTFQMYE